MKIFKHIGKTLIALSFACGAVLTACTAEDISEVKDPNVGFNPSESKYYINLRVTASGGAKTRTFTDENGNASTDTSTDNRVPGSDEETRLASATLYFVLENSGVEEVVLTLPVEGISATSTDEQYTLRAEISFDQLKSLAETKPKLYLLGNTNVLYANLKHDYNTDSTDGKKIQAIDAKFLITDADNRPLGKYGEEGLVMPLVNAKSFTVDFSDIPKDAEDEEIWAAIAEIFTKEPGTTNRVFSTGTLDLERAVARIEFKDIDRTGFSDLERDPNRMDPDEPEAGGAGGGTEIEGEVSNAGNNIIYTRAENEIGTSKPYTYYIGDSGILIELYSLQAININKTSYLFRHTAEGTSQESDYYANTAASLFGAENGGGTNYKWVVGGDWAFATNKYTKTTTFLNGLTKTEDEWSVNGNGATITVAELEGYEVESDEDGYHPWCYVTENVLPSTTLMTEETLPANATGVAFTFKVLDKYGVPVTKTTPANRLPSGIEIGDEDDEYVMTLTQNDGYWQKAAYTGEEKDSEGNVTTPGYYTLTYYGFIKHNDPSGSGLKPMNYGVVRNNTYQLTVNGVAKLPNPKEPESMFIALEIKVLAWMKRNISVSF